MVSVEHDFLSAPLGDPQKMESLRGFLDAAAKDGWTVVSMAATDGKVVVLLRRGGA